MTSFEVRNAGLNIAWGTRQGQHLHSWRVDSLRSGGFARFLTKKKGAGRLDLPTPCEFPRLKDSSQKLMVMFELKSHVVTSNATVLVSRFFAISTVAVTLYEPGSSII